MRVNVGDIILVTLLCFDGHTENAMFMVVHHDGDLIKGSTRFQAVKISTKPTTFQVSLRAQCHPFLRYDSFINCSIISSFIEEQVINIVGRANPYIIKTVSTQLSKYFDSVNSQMELMSNRIVGDREC